VEVLELNKWTDIHVPKVKQSEEEYYLRSSPAALPKREGSAKSRNNLKKKPITQTKKENISKISMLK
jgi:hypothetical protein